ncbi:MAG: hypothetical protein HRT94_00445 [Alphaproteobacteria bacterium]|nr:hypothetical protein [Alphaproteobacteria bacterium]
MSYTRTSIVGLCASLALATAAQAQDLGPDINIAKDFNDAVFTAPVEPEIIHAYIESPNGNIMRDFTACTDNGHYVMGRYAARTDHQHVNYMWDTRGVEETARQFAITDTQYDFAVRHVIQNMSNTDLSRLNYTFAQKWRDAIRDNIDVVYDSFVEGSDLDFDATQIERGFVIDYVSRAPLPALCASA